MVAMTLFVVTLPKPPTECPRIEKPPVGTQVGVFRLFQGDNGCLIPTQKEFLAVVAHVLENGDQVAGPHVAAAQPRGAVIDPR